MEHTVEMLSRERDPAGDAPQPGTPDQKDASTASDDTEHAATLERLRPGLPDVLLAARCHAHGLVEKASLEDGVFEIADAVFSERASSRGG